MSLKRKTKPVATLSQKGRQDKGARDPLDQVDRSSQHPQVQGNGHPEKVNQVSLSLICASSPLCSTGAFKDKQELNDSVAK